MTELHDTTVLVWAAIETFWAAKGYSPSIRDIMEATGISSKSVVHYHLLKLEQAGIIERTPRVARSYVLKRGGPDERQVQSAGRMQDASDRSR